MPAVIPANQETMQLEVTAARRAVLGAHSLRISATAAACQQETTLALEVTKPDGLLRLKAPERLTVSRGGQDTFEIHLEREDFSGPVQVELAGLPQQVVSEPLIIPAEEESGRLLVQVDLQAAAGEYPLELTAGQGVIQVRQRLLLRLEDPPGKIELSVPAQLLLRPGERGALAVQLMRQGVPDAVRLCLADLPGQVTYGTVVVPPGVCEAKLELLAAADIRVVDREIQVMALATGVEAAAPLRLLVQEESVPADAEVALELRKTVHAGQGTLEPLAEPPQPPATYFQRGQTWLEGGDFARAAEEFRKAIRGDPQYGEAHHCLGLALYRLGKYGDAIDAYGLAIVHLTDNAAVYRNRGDAHGALRDFERTRADYDLAIKLNPQDAAAFNNRGVLSAREGKLPLALEDHHQAIRLAPAEPLYFTNRGDAYQRCGETDKALSDYGRSLQLDKTCAAAYLSRGLAMAAGGHLRSAIADYNHVLWLRPKEAAAYVYRGQAHLASGAPELAIKDFSEAITLQGNKASYYIYRGNAYRSQGQHHKAIADYTEALRLEPHNAVAHNQRGLAHDTLRAYEQAIADYTAALENGGDPCTTYCNRGWAYYALKEYPQAIIDAGQAIKADPKNAPAHKLRGVARLALQAYLKAQSAVDLHMAEQLKKKG
jgi:tetratricopeptide (TPR) repeat protein